MTEGSEKGAPDLPRLYATPAGVALGPLDLVPDGRDAAQPRHDETAEGLVGTVVGHDQARDVGELVGTQHPGDDPAAVRGRVQHRQRIAREQPAFLQAVDVDIAGNLTIISVPDAGNVKNSSVSGGLSFGGKPGGLLSLGGVSVGGGTG